MERLGGDPARPETMLFLALRQSRFHAGETLAAYGNGEGGEGTGYLVAPA